MARKVGTNRENICNEFRNIITHILRIWEGFETEWDKEVSTFFQTRSL